MSKSVFQIQLGTDFYKDINKILDMAWNRQGSYQELKESLEKEIEKKIESIHSSPIVSGGQL